MHKEPLRIAALNKDNTTNLALDTIKRGKQALIFVNSKRSAEASAERVAKAAGKQDIRLEELAKQILSAVTKPTKQCKRLAYCIKRAQAFHHSGLTSKQRALIEDAFREGNIHTISATPTLAAGVDTPAFRTIIRDIKRFTGAGMQDIPVLEYHQMAGRSGRPDYGDDYGEAILITKTEADAKRLTEKYIYGEPEAIYSKVAAQPVLRTYCLSLAASEYVTTLNELQTFFAETFFAHQYGDAKAIENKITQTVEQLRDWGFLKQTNKTPADEFTNADKLITNDNQLQATPLGKRVSELYLDPLSAHELIDGMYSASTNKPAFFAWIHLVCSAAEARPLLRVKAAEYEELHEFLKETPDLLVNEPSIYDPEYEQYLETIKTAQMLHAWTQEISEEELLETYNVRPGELRRRLDIADWLCYSSSELARILKFHHHIAPLQKTRRRLKYGAKEELLALLRLRGVGRVRARKLYKNGVRNAKDLKAVDAHTLKKLVGPKTAQKLKEQVGESIQATPPSKHKRKGQLSLHAKRFNK